MDGERRTADGQALAQRSPIELRTCLCLAMEKWPVGPDGAHGSMGAESGAVRCGAVLLLLPSGMAKADVRERMSKTEMRQSGPRVPIVATHSDWNGRQLAWPRCLASTRASLGAFNFALSPTPRFGRCTSQHCRSPQLACSTQFHPALHTLPRPPKRAGWATLSWGVGDPKKADRVHTTPISTPKSTETANRKRQSPTGRRRRGVGMELWMDARLHACVRCLSQPRCLLPHHRLPAMRDRIDKRRTLRIDGHPEIQRGPNQTRIPTMAICGSEIGFSFGPTPLFGPSKKVDADAESCSHPLATEKATDAFERIWISSASKSAR
jgi:hypothetical protein